MGPPGIFNSSKQLAAVLCGFVLACMLFESEGLRVWAQRLEIGPLRSVAVKATAALGRAVQPLGIEPLRRTALRDLQKIGWSDDPAPPVETAAAAKPRAVTGTGAVTVQKPVVDSVPPATVLSPLSAISGDRPRVVALAGDSMMAVALSSVLLRETANRKDLQIVKAFKSGTGLARPEVFDWMREYPAMIAAAQPDVVFVAIGANDGQGFVEGGEVMPFGSDKWIDVYRKRLRDFLDLLTRDGARVVWIGLPPMRQSDYDNKIAEINRIAYTVVSASSKASWWNPAPYLGDEAGHYREFAVFPDNKTTRIRAADGIHMSDEGAALLTAVLLPWLAGPQ